MLTNRRLVISALLFLVTCGSTLAQSQPTNRTSITQLVIELNDAYMKKELGRLDAVHPYMGKVKLFIEHSLLEGKEQYEVERLPRLLAWKSG
jgi:hypothetical protein